MSIFVDLHLDIKVLSASGVLTKGADLLAGSGTNLHASDREQFHRSILNRSDSSLSLLSSDSLSCSRAGSHRGKNYLIWPEIANQVEGRMRTIDYFARVLI